MSAYLIALAAGVATFYPALRFCQWVDRIDRRAPQRDTGPAKPDPIKVRQAAVYRRHVRTIAMAEAERCPFGTLLRLKVQHAELGQMIGLPEHPTGPKIRRRP